MKRNITYAVLSFIFILGLFCLIHNNGETNILKEGETLTDAIINDKEDSKPTTSILEESKKVLEVYEHISEGQVSKVENKNNVIEMEEFDDSDVNKYN